MRQLTELSKQCREIVLKAKEALGEELGGHSMLDLVADQIQDASIRDLQDALVVAGVGYKGSERIYERPTWSDNPTLIDPNHPSQRRRD